MTITTDPTNPDLSIVDASTGLQKAYLVLSEEDRAKGFVMPYRDSYIHTCGVLTVMGRSLSETYARDPKFYGATYCTGCLKHFPVNQFRWEDGEVVGS